MNISYFSIVWSILVICTEFYGGILDKLFILWLHSIHQPVWVGNINKELCTKYSWNPAICIHIANSDSYFANKINGKPTSWMRFAHWIKHLFPIIYSIAWANICSCTEYIKLKPYRNWNDSIFITNIQRSKITGIDGWISHEFTNAGGDFDAKKFNQAAIPRSIDLHLFLFLLWLM